MVRFEDIDANAAMPACDWAVQTYPNEPRYSVQLGRAYEKAGSAEAAMDAYAKAEKQGAVAAAYLIGLIHLEGKGSFAKNPAIAASWFKKSADKGYAPAQTVLGILYEQGLGVTKDQELARRLLQRATDQADTIGLIDLARKYLARTGIERDDAKAFSLMMKAAEENDPVGQFGVAYMLTFGQGTQRDPKAAIPWLQKSADQGHADAQYALGLELLKGESTKKDDARAHAWFVKAANQGNANSMLALSNMYADGLVVSKDEKEAIVWLHKAAEAGNDIARERLKSQEAQTANTPVVDKAADLREAYTNYLTVKTCYDMRKDYVIRIISEDDVAVAKKAMRKIEDSSVLSKEDKDTAWKAGNEKGQAIAELAELARTFGASGYSDNVNFACRAALSSLREAAGPENAGVRKRDF
ncbi:tetratricopeptide repeat protein [Afipia clevelandensis]|uniref:Sel1 repeat protein n=1 Tax=Afipia clevelandensis ATCC 49720 TaxID=883079 RepID=K8NQK9_9BRAD|nr:tetratricopeptide repeat protein [Afipia clevelandensis]EKS32662.1 hypothetical protein HMPREF9696_03639 [Afipia clevelandensis ATCC 49720]